MPRYHAATDADVACLARDQMQSPTVAGQDDSSRAALSKDCFSLPDPEGGIWFRMRVGYLMVAHSNFEKFFGLPCHHVERADASICRAELTRSGIYDAVRSGLGVEVAIAVRVGPGACLIKDRRTEI